MSDGGSAKKDLATADIRRVLQLLPALRRRLPALHRGVGRVFMVGALTGSLSGLYLLWAKGTVGDLGQHLGMTLNALLIMAFAGLAWRAARARDFAAHRRWALRLFAVAPADGDVGDLLADEVLQPAGRRDVEVDHRAQLLLAHDGDGHQDRRD